MPRFRQTISSSSNDTTSRVFGSIDGTYPEEHRNQERLRAGEAGYGFEFFASAMRFVSVDIPNGAIVDRARLRIYVLDASSAGAAQFAAFAEDNSSVPTFRDLLGESRQSLTVARTMSGAYRRREDPSINVKDIIQEIVNRPGWKAGNSLTIAAIPGDAEGELSWLAFAAEEHEKAAPRLTVDWREPIRLPPVPTFERPQPDPPVPQPPKPKPQPKPEPEIRPTVWCSVYG